MTTAMRRLVTRVPAPPAPVEERCEFCAGPIDERHGHVADLHDHRLLCVCRACYLLFAPRGAGGGRYRGIGESVRPIPDFELTPAQWDALAIPVDLAFFLRQDGTLRAFYPGPAGAAESELDLAGWADIERANPELSSLEPEVEAVLLRRRRDGFSGHIVPIDRCYELVGLVRATWRGLGGGNETWQAVDAFFAKLDES